MPLNISQNYCVTSDNFWKCKECSKIIKTKGGTVSQSNNN